MSRQTRMNPLMLAVLWTLIVEQCKTQKPIEWMKQVMHLAIEDCQRRNLILRDRATVRRVVRRAITAMMCLDDANIHSIITGAERYADLEKKLEEARKDLDNLGMGVHNRDCLRTDNNPLNRRHYE